MAWNFLSSIIFGAADPIKDNLQRSAELLLETEEIYQKIRTSPKAASENQQIMNRIYEIICETRDIDRRANDLKSKETTRISEINKTFEKTKQILTNTRKISEILEKMETQASHEATSSEISSEYKDDDKSETHSDISRPDKMTVYSLKQQKKDLLVEKEAKKTETRYANLKGYKQEASIGHHQPTHASACDQARNKETEYHKKDKQIKEKEQFIQDNTEDNEVNLRKEHALQKNATSPFIQLLKKLDFYKYFPQQLTLSNALSICQVEADHEIITEPGILMKLMLQKIMMSNYTSRELVLHTKVDIDDDDDDDNDDDTAYITLNPMDALIAIIHCADDFLRQDIYSKLTFSQLAVPLLLPNPVDNTIVFPRWAMRSIVKNWKCCRGESEVAYFEGCVIEQESPLISFIRFSRPCTQSKSKILNNVISKQKHSIFFDCDCDGSQAKRIVNGIVEVSWYLPVGEKSDHFNNFITFANLRGNACDYEEQLKLVVKYSDMVFVFMQEDDVTTYESCFRKLASVADQKSQIVFLADKWPKVKKNKINNMIKNSTYMSLEKNGLAAIVASVQSKITTRINEGSPLHLCNLSQVNEFNIQIDEHNEACNLSMVLATDIISDIKDKPIFQAKMTMVPLQGPDLWHKWACLNKEVERIEYKGEETEGIETYHLEKSKEKDDIRKQQIKKAEELSVVMQKFVRSLSACNSKEKNFFLKWLRFHMDDHSRENLPALQKNCQAIRSQLRDKTLTDENEIKDLQNDLQKKAEQLIYASFGVEHLFRELGQIYEAAVEIKGQFNNSDIPFDIKNFPILAAKLLMSGHPLELIDGDAAHIPITWIIAVLKELRILIGNSNMLILSVLGIQSSGKSTLMNTTFGVQFAVSAGRCTRGAYFQLLQLDPEFATKEAKCKYMLIIDTEGLRAPELDAQQTQQHDNELATLVIGLANVTIINIYGEVPADIDDILQTSVHAFLRMKEVMEKLKPACIFVRQNVASVAANKNAEGRQKFFEKLDNTTAIAAKAEGCEDKYKYFNDVIAFDENDIIDFPNLWEGNPPMAPVNPAYCDTCLKLKSKIIDLCKSEDFVCTLDNFTDRIDKLWGAVLKENFVFSFKNTLEIEAYRTLDTEYGKWSWRLQNIFFGWQNETETLINSHSIDELAQISERQVNIINSELDVEYSKIKKDFDKFFEQANSSIASLIIQWKANHQLKLKGLLEGYKKKAEEFCKNRIQKKNATTVVEKNNDQFRSNFTAHIKKFVSERNIDPNNIDTHGVDVMFNKEWKNQINEIKKKYSLPTKQNIGRLIVNEIGQKLFDDDQLFKKLQMCPLEKRGQPLQLTVDIDSHLKINRGIVGQFKDFLGVSQHNEKCIQMAQEKTDHMIKRVSDYLSQPNIISYDDLHIHQIIIMLTEEMNATNVNFTFTPEYRSTLILEVAGYALHVFNNKQEEEHKNHPITYMESLKDGYRAMFNNLCKQLAEEKSAAICLTNFIMPRIKSPLQNQLAAALAGTTQVLFSSIIELRGMVLLELLEKQDFNLYKTYLTNISESYLYWIKKKLDQHCNKKEGGIKIIEILAKEELEKLLHKVKTAAKDSDRKRGFKKWLESFHAALSTVLVVTVKELEDFVKLKPNGDLELLTEELENGIDQHGKTYLSRHPDILNPAVWCDDHHNPAVMILSLVVGCQEQCPFCGEQCEQRSGHDTNHACKLHRPQCLGGWRSSLTQIMTIDICTDLVATDDRTFKCSATNDKPVPYKDYHTIYPISKWNIQCDKNQVAPYWKWFIVKYEKNITEHFKFKSATLPQDWKNVTQDAARKDIIKRYQLKLV